MMEKDDVALIRWWVWHGDHEAVAAISPSRRAVEAKYREAYGIPDDVPVYVGTSVPLPLI